MKFLKTCQKSIASFVGVCFLFSLIIPPSEVFAQPQMENVPFAFVPMGIPQELGSIEEIFIPNSQEGRLPLIHIQSVHAHSETQRKIYGLLKFLDEKYGIESLFIEGAGEELNPGYFHFFEDNRLNIRVAERLVEKGELTGAELFLIESEREIPAYGLENPSLYRQNLTTFQTVMSQRALTSRFTKETHSVLDRLETLLLAPEARRLLRLSESFDAAQLQLSSYLFELERRAHEILRLDLRHFESQLDWPQIIRILRLQEIESGLDPEKIQYDRQKLIAFMKELRLDPSLVEGFEHLAFSPFQSGMVYDPGFRKNDLPRYLAERLVAATLEKGFSFEQYPYFTRFLEAAILQSELEAERLFDEMEKLFETLVQAIATKDEEWKLVGYVHQERLLERLFDLELTPKDYGKMEVFNQTERPLVRFLLEIESLHEMTNLGRRKLVPDNVGDLESVYGEAVRFYQLAKEREEIMVDKILTTPSPNPLPPQGGEDKGEGGITILITGGFHTEGVSRLFRKKQIPYTIVSPRIAEKVSPEAYVSALLGEKKTAFDVAYLEADIDFEGQGMLDQLRPEKFQMAMRRSEIRTVLEAVIETARAETREGRLPIAADRLIDTINETLYAQDRRFTLKRSEARDKVLLWDNSTNGPLPNLVGNPVIIPVDTLTVETPILAPRSSQLTADELAKEFGLPSQDEVRRTTPLPPPAKPTAFVKAAPARQSFGRAEVRSQDDLTPAFAAIQEARDHLVKAMEVIDPYWDSNDSLELIRLKIENWLAFGIEGQYLTFGTEGELRNNHDLLSQVYLFDQRLEYVRQRLEKGILDDPEVHEILSDLSKRLPELGGFVDRAFTFGSTAQGHSQVDLYQNFDITWKQVEALRGYPTDPGYFRKAANAVAKISPFLKPVPFEVWHERAKPKVALAIRWLQTYKDKEYHHHAFALLYEVAPYAEAALPLLIQILSAGEPKDVFQPFDSALTIVDAMGPSAKDAIPVLIKILSSEKWTRRAVAASALGNIGPEAKTTVGELIKRVNDTKEEFTVRRRANEALAKIDPNSVQPEPRAEVRKVEDYGEFISLEGTFDTVDELFEKGEIDSFAATSLKEFQNGNYGFVIPLDADWIDDKESWAQSIKDIFKEASAAVKFRLFKVTEKDGGESFLVIVFLKKGEKYKPSRAEVRSEVDTGLQPAVRAMGELLKGRYRLSPVSGQGLTPRDAGLVFATLVVFNSQQPDRTMTFLFLKREKPIEKLPPFEMQAKLYEPRKGTLATRLLYADSKEGLALKVKDILTQKFPDGKEVGQVLDEWTQTTRAEVRTSPVKSKVASPVDPNTLSDFARFVFRKGTTFGSQWNWVTNAPYAAYGNVSSDYFHTGVDFLEYQSKDGKVLSIPVGTPVKAIVPGKVVLSKSGKEEVIIETADKKLIRYGHIKSLVSEGSQIKAGEVIGVIYISPFAPGIEPHLHLEVITDYQLPSRGKTKRGYLSKILKAGAKSIDPFSIWPELTLETKIDLDDSKILRAEVRGVSNEEMIAFTFNDRRIVAPFSGFIPASIRDAQVLNQAQLLTALIFAGLVEGNVDRAMLAQLRTYSNYHPFEPVSPNESLVIQNVKRKEGAKRKGRPSLKKGLDIKPISIVTAPKRKKPSDPPLFQVLESIRLDSRFTPFVAVETDKQISFFVLSDDKEAQLLESKDLKSLGVPVPPSSKINRITLITKQRAEVRSEPTKKEQRLLQELKLEIDPQTGRLRYGKDFQPISLRSDLWLVRHGQTLNNQLGEESGQPRFQGASDLPVNQLTPKGEKQAEETAQRLLQELSSPIESVKIRVFTSPLGRAKNTILPFIQSVKERYDKEFVLQERKGLAEIDFGAWDNLTEQEIKEKLGEGEYRKIRRYRGRLDPRVKNKTGESFLELLGRVKQELLDLDRLLSEKGETGVGATHGTWISAALVLMGDPKVVDSKGLIDWRAKMVPVGQPLLLNTTRRAGVRSQSTEEILKAWADLDNAWSVVKTANVFESNEGFYKLVTTEGIFNEFRQLQGIFHEARGALQSSNFETAKERVSEFQKKLTDALDHLDRLIAQDEDKLAELSPQAAQATFAIAAIKMDPALLESGSKYRFSFGEYSLKELVEEGWLKVDLQYDVVTPKLPDILGIVSDQYPPTLRKKLQDTTSALQVFIDKVTPRAEVRAEGISGRGDGGIGESQRSQKDLLRQPESWESKSDASGQPSFSGPLRIQQRASANKYMIQPAPNNSKSKPFSRTKELMIKPARATVPALMRNFVRAFRRPSVNSNIGLPPNERNYKLIIENMQDKDLPRAEVRTDTEKEIIEQVLKAYDLDDYIAYGNLSGGFKNRGFIVQSTQGKFFLKHIRNEIYAENMEEFAGFEMQLNHFINEKVRERGYAWKVPYIFKTRDGKAYTRVGDRLYMIYEYTEGEFAGWGGAAGVRLPLTAELMAQMHSILHEYNGAIPKDQRTVITSYKDLPEVITDFKQFKHEVGERLAGLRDENKALAEQFLQIVDPFIEALQKILDNYPKEAAEQEGWQLVHRDFAPVHIQFDVTQPALVIDWENANFDTPAVDFIRGIVPLSSSHDFSNLIDLVAHYQIAAEKTGNPLTSTMIQSIPYVHVLHLVRRVDRMLEKEEPVLKGLNTPKIQHMQSVIDFMGIDYSSFETQVLRRIEEIKAEMKKSVELKTAPSGNLVSRFIQGSHFGYGDNNLIRWLSDKKLHIDARLSEGGFNFFSLKMKDPQDRIDITGYGTFKIGVKIYALEENKEFANIRPKMKIEFKRKGHTLDVEKTPEITSDAEELVLSIPLNLDELDEIFFVLEASQGSIRHIDFEIIGLEFFPIRVGKVPRSEVRVGGKQPLGVTSRSFPTDIVSDQKARADEENETQSGQPYGIQLTSPPFRFSQESHKDERKKAYHGRKADGKVSFLEEVADETRSQKDMGKIGEHPGEAPSSIGSEDPFHTRSESRVKIVENQEEISLYENLNLPRAEVRAGVYQSTITLTIPEKTGPTRERNYVIHLEELPSENSKGHLVIHTSVEMPEKDSDHYEFFTFHPDGEMTFETVEYTPSTKTTERSTYSLTKPQNNPVGSQSLRELYRYFRTDFMRFAQVLLQASEKAKEDHRVPLEVDEFLLNSRILILEKLKGALTPLQEGDQGPARSEARSTKDAQGFGLSNKSKADARVKETPESHSRLSPKILEDNKRLRKLGFGRARGALKPERKKYAGWLADQIFEQMGTFSPPASRLLEKEGHEQVIEIFTNALVRMREGSLRRLERDGFLPDGLYEALRRHSREMDIAALTRHLIQFLDKYEEKGIPVGAQKKLLSGLIPYGWIEDWMKEYGIERSLAQHAAVGYPSDPDTYLRKVLGKAIPRSETRSEAKNDPLPGRRILPQLKAEQSVVIPGAEIETGRIRIPKTLKDRLAPAAGPVPSLLPSGAQAIGYLSGIAPLALPAVAQALGDRSPIAMMQVAMIFERDDQPNPLMDPLFKDPIVTSAIMEAFRVAVTKGVSKDLQVSKLMKEIFDQKSIVGSLMQKGSDTPGAHAVIFDHLPTRAEVSAVLLPAILNRHLFVELLFTPEARVDEQKIRELSKEAGRLIPDAGDRIIFHPSSATWAHFEETLADMSNRLYKQMSNKVTLPSLNQFARERVVVSVSETVWNQFSKIETALPKEIQSILYAFGPEASDYIAYLGAEALLASKLAQSLLSRDQKRPLTPITGRRFRVDGNSLGELIASTQAAIDGLERMLVAA